MKLRNALLAGWGLLLTAGPAVAQARADALQPVQTISLGAHGTVGGTVALPNHNLVLLLTDAVSPDITAQCLAPDGHTLWKTTLTRLQHPIDKGVGLVDMRRIALGTSAKADKQLQKEKLEAMLNPVNAFTDGNDLVLAEYLGGDAVKNYNKTASTKLTAGQVLVQRLNAQGTLTRFFFEPRPEPANKKTEAEILGRYADANGYVEVLRETNKREETTAFCAMHYDLKTKSVRREPLELPANPPTVGNMNNFRHWYQDWAYLGHRPNQTYFCRRTVVNGPKEKAGNQPITYQVHIADDQGALAGGFSTNLGLNKGTRPAYSGDMRCLGELNHIPTYFDQSMGKRYITYDEWDISSGATGSFYLDYRTGDVLIYGEYGQGDLPSMTDTDLYGFFERRYAADGRVLAQVQGPYSATMRDNKKKLSFKGYQFREARFHLDPLTNRSQYSFSPRSYTFSSANDYDDFNLFMDQDLKPAGYEFVSGKDRDKRTFTSVLYAQPFMLTTGNGLSQEVRIYEHPAKDDHPVYAALEKQRRASGADMPDYWFYLSPTGPATGLVVEQKLGIGGQLQVYTFQ
jgi:hypothetical protein